LSIGVAVIGCGSTAHRRHLPSWAALPGVRLVAVVSRDARRRQEAAARYGAARAYSDWRQALDDPEVTAVDICVPHSLHAEIAVAAARAGRHVLCEKPMATDLRAAEEMVATAEHSGVVLMPFHNMTTGGTARRALDLVRAGAVGRPILIRGVMAHGGPDAADPGRRWFLSEEAGGGAILDLGPHLFDLVAHLAGQPAQRLRATLRREGGPGERDGLVEVAFPDGGLAQIALSWSHVAGRETRLVVQGTGGVLHVNFLLQPEPSPGVPAAPLALARPGTPARVEYPEPSDGIDPCVAFVAAVQGNSALVTAMDGLETVRYIDAAYRSDRAGGSWVPVDRQPGRPAA
jgi:UDP-N-acetylglucosamine 3-dehydrogenase